MIETGATRKDYKPGIVHDYLERLMLGKSQINKQLLAYVMKNVPENEKVPGEEFLSEIQQELERISKDIQPISVAQDLDEVEKSYSDNPDITELIKKIKLGEPDNIVLGYN